MWFFCHIISPLNILLQCFCDLWLFLFLNFPLSWVYEITRLWHFKFESFPLPYTHNDIIQHVRWNGFEPDEFCAPQGSAFIGLDRKSTRLNSSHGYISYAVFCL